MHLRTPLAIVLIALVATSCGGGDDDDAETTERPTPSSSAPPLEFELERGEAVVASAGGDVALDNETQQDVMDASQKYVELAVLGPLLNGKVGKGYSDMFDAAVASAADADRAALTDEGIPQATTTPAVTATPVRIDAVADALGTVLFVAASFDLDIRAETEQGEMSVIRTSEPTFAPGPDDDWLLTAYRVSAQRDLPKAKTTTTTAEEG